jgi:8-oxo-dGTP pyrophosphatase MutT (NUDIX family)
MRDVIPKLFPGPGISPDPDRASNVWPVPADEGASPGLRSAAVLVPLIAHDNGMTILFTERAEELNAHAGQISFPGGRVADGERAPEQTALRETEEEIGVPPSEIEIIGRLNGHDTSTGYRVIPVVGILNPPLVLNPDPGEVARIFEVPLDFIADPANHVTDTRVIRGRERKFRAMPYGDDYIWGLTARILYDFAALLRDA